MDNPETRAILGTRQRKEKPTIHETKMVSSTDPIKTRIEQWKLCRASQHRTPNVANCLIATLCMYLSVLYGQ